MHLPAVFPDSFAIEWGHDEFGTFQSFAVGDVVQRMRWIPPGSFIMGSPESEVGRFDNEVQHKVEISNGFWLGDTPVTQALWVVIMDANPSFFQGVEHPVENISWNECQEFIARLNQRIDGVQARLPTEEEWEYACRAGTTTATWVGDVQQVEANFVLWLDDIAWYAGNSIFDDTEWQSKEDRRFRQGTHPVERKSPNSWGLYDMLGNVYEYCADIPVDYMTKFSNREKNEKVMGLRNVRGGSWRSMPKYVRAANRGEDSEVAKANDLGFRIARSATPSP